MAVIPTKSNLLAAKRSLALAKTGYDLMDKKRNILIREMMGMIDQAAALQSSIDETFQTAFQALQSAHITLGIAEHAAQAVPIDEGLQLRFRTVMGVELPIVKTDPPPLKPYYGMSDTNSMLDEAYFRFNKVKEFITTLAEVESSVYRLALAIRATQKRANALKNIVIPRLTAEIQRISEALEDKDREDFVRLKSIKRQKAKKAEG
jgi:V/A-type H+-transporting ATPase subunit D